MNWPDEVKQRLGGRDPQIGDWFAFCCNNDAYQIKTQEQLESLYEEVETYTDEGLSFEGFFPNEESVSEHFGGMG